MLRPRQADDNAQAVTRRLIQHTLWRRCVCANRIRAELGDRFEVAYNAVANGKLRSVTVWCKRTVCDATNQKPAAVDVQKFSRDRRYASHCSAIAPLTAHAYAG